MKQLKVGLPDEVRSQLERAAKKAGRSASEEARLRLEVSLDLDYYDPAALELSEHVLGLADSISRFSSNGMLPLEGWHKNPVFFEALKIAVETWFGLVAPPQSESTSEIDPPTLGRSVALSQHRYLLERSKFDREMDLLRYSLKDKPALHYHSEHYGSGTLTVGEVDPVLAEEKRAKSARAKKPREKDKS